MKSNVPWSVKGIEQDARAAAKSAARQAGMTVGEWLNSVIYEAGNGAEGVDRAARAAGDLENFREAFDKLARRVEAAEHRSGAAVSGLDTSLAAAIERLDSVERVLRAGGARGGAGPDLSAFETRLSALERGGRRPDNLKALEGMLQALVRQIEAGRSETHERLDANDSAMRALARRLDSTTQDLAAAIDEVRNSTEEQNARIARAEQAAAEASARPAEQGAGEEFVARTSKRLRVLGDELRRESEQLKHIEGAIERLHTHIEEAERRSAEGVGRVSDTVATLENRLEAAAPARLKAEINAAVSSADRRFETQIADLQASFEALADRLTARIPKDDPFSLQFDAPENAHDDAGDEMVRDDAPASAAQERDDVFDASEAGSAPEEDRLEPFDEEREFAIEDVLFEPAPHKEPQPDAAPTPRRVVRPDEAAGETRREATADMSGEDDDDSALFDDALSLGAEHVVEPPQPTRPDDFLRAARLAARSKVETGARRAQPSRVKPAPAQAAPTAESPKASAAPRAEARRPEAETRARRRAALERAGASLHIERDRETADSGDARKGMPVRLVAGAVGAGLIATAAGGWLLFGGGLQQNTPAPEPAATTTPQAPAANAAAPDAAALYREGASELANASGKAAFDHALNTVRSAAVLGYAPAQVELGEYYKGEVTPPAGVTVEPNYEDARRWYRQAAEKGNRLAMHRLGVMYARGQGGRIDYAEAVRWLEQAANLGHVDSQYNLGVLYHPATGDDATPIQDAAKAYYWYALAARNGDAQSRALADAVGATLSDAEREAADSAVASWTPKTLDPAANDLSAR